MSDLSSFQKASKTAALEICENGPATVAKLQGAVTEHFGTSPLSAVAQKYGSLADPSKNASLSTGIAVAIDAVDAVVGDFRALSQYVNLTIPKMEDGNNFGVTVQLSSLKQMSDATDSLNKHVEELGKFASARADALEKCKMPGKSVSTTSTESTSNSEGKSAEKGDVSSNSKSSSTETKTSSTTSDSPELAWRLQALTQVDTMYYAKAKAAMEVALSSYLAVLDFLEKNSEKIGAPKGETSSGPAYASMY